ncbi:TSCPD domain-containing protein, partial [Dysosmobacter welbionis]
QHALVLSAGDRLEAVTGTGAGLTADHGDGAGVAAELRPIGDSAGVDGGDLLQGQVGDGVLSVDDHGDAVQGHDGLSQAARLLVIGQ